MKAVRLHTRGGPEQIVIDDAPIPEPAAGEVRVKVRAAAITPDELKWDKTYQNPDGSPRLPTIPCHDVAGIVDATGPQVSGVAIGDPVFGLIDFPFNGSAAEYAIMPAADIAPAPRSIDLIHAAAIPLSALTAWQALFDNGKLAAGQRVLIHGGAGGVGAFAVQLARWRGAHVIATASTASVELVGKVGASEVVDYTTTRFDEVVRGVDVVFDTVGGDTLTNSFETVRRGGNIVSIAGKPDQNRAAEIGVNGIFFIVKPSGAQLKQITGLVDAGHIRVNLEAIFRLADARKAFERSVAGHLRGKVMLRVE